MEYKADFHGSCVYTKFIIIIILFFISFIYTDRLRYKLKPVFLAGQCDSVYVKYCYVNMRIKDGMTGW